MNILYIPQENAKKTICYLGDYDEELLLFLNNNLSTPFHFITLSDLDWNADLSPWPYQNFKGQGNCTLEKNMKECEKRSIPIDDNFIIAGYSLGGLLALSSLIQYPITRCAAMSSSLWYPDFLETIQNANLENKTIYLSLGDKEYKTKHPLMKEVQNKHEALVNLLKEKNDIFFEYNPGNHFKDVNIRILKGIRYFL